MVGNVYICQPLLAQIAHDLVVTERTSSLVAVATQIGYALGILLVVPLADMAEPARLMRWLLALTALRTCKRRGRAERPMAFTGVRLFRTPYGGAANPYAAPQLASVFCEEQELDKQLIRTFPFLRQATTALRQLLR